MEDIIEGHHSIGNVVEHASLIHACGDYIYIYIVQTGNLYI